LKGFPNERYIWERFYVQMFMLIIRIFPRKRYYKLFIIFSWWLSSGDHAASRNKKVCWLLVMRELKFIEHFKKITIYFKWLKIYVWCWMHNMKYYNIAFLQLERKVFKQRQRNWPSYSWLIFSTLKLYGMLKLLFICTDDIFYLRGEN
jgi:hypothetical protein